MSGDDTPWVMPDWMEPYRQMLESTAGGNTVEEMIKRFRTETYLIRTNLPVYLMAHGVDMQVRLLLQLRAAGKLED